MKRIKIAWKCIFQSKEEANEQFGRKMSQDVIINESCSGSSKVGEDGRT